MLPLLLLIVTVIFLVAYQMLIVVPSLPHLATVRASKPRSASSPANVLTLTHHHPAGVARPGGPSSTREARRSGRRDPLRHHRAIVGRDVRTPWYIRVRAVLVLLLIVIGLGMALAGITLLIIASGRFVLEILGGG